MARDKTVQYQAYIGAFVLAGVALLAALAFWGGPTGLFTGNYYVIARMSHIGDLTGGAPVRMAGIKIGKVSRIRLSDDGTAVLVTLRIEDDINLPTTAVASVATAGLVGDSFLEITRNPNPAPRDKAEGEGKTAAEPVENFIPHVKDPENAHVIKSRDPFNLGETLGRMESIGEQLNTLLTNVNQVIGEPNFKDNLLKITANVESVTARTDRLLTHTDKIVESVQEAVNNVKNVTVRLDGIAVEAQEAAREVGAMVKTVRATVDETVGNPSNIAIINRAIDDMGAVASGARATVDNLRQITDAVGPDRVKGLLEQGETLLATTRETVDTVKGKIQGLDTDTVNAAIGDVGNAATRLAAMFQAVDPDDVGEAVKRVVKLLGQASGMVEEIMDDPAKALALNKAVDRAMDVMFKEMGRAGIKNSEAIMAEIRRQWNDWRGQYMPDPAYPDPAKAPYRRP